MRRTFRWLTCCVILLLVISSCKKAPQPTPSAATAAPVEKMAIIFDDDGSPDGTTALMYLLVHPQVDLKAVSISYGEAHPEVYIQHIARKLDSFGISGIPLGYGQDAPLAGTNEFPEGMRQSANDFWGFPIPNAEKTYPAQPAAELMVSLINQSPAPVTVFISGPLTNLAQALGLDPGIRDHIKAVYIMGGAVNVPGNISELSAEIDNQAAEWNIYADPQAAQMIFESGMDIYLVPLDATNQVMISKQDTRQWRKGNEIADFSAEIYDTLMNSWGAKTIAVWDLMTAAIMLKPDLCTFTPLHLEVITAEGSTSGQTAVISGEEANVNVCLEPEVGLIKQALIDVFSKSQ
jgi:pyrimidine-specific ribonucleoside hydrolase